MNWKVALLGICFLLAKGAYAQETPSATADSLPEFALGKSLPTVLLSRPPAAIAADPRASASAAPERGTPGGAPQGVYGVFPNYAWQVGVGYTFMRFYMLPGHTLTMNGVNVGASYFPRASWIGADGQIIGLFGSTLFGDRSKLAIVAGGPRFRWIGPRDLELWGHGLVGMAHELPQVAGKKQGAFAYEVGGGVDVNVHHKRFAYRAEADMVGTRFFSTYQYSPQVSVGVVLKF